MSPFSGVRRQARVRGKCQAERGGAQGGLDCIRYDIGGNNLMASGRSKEYFLMIAQFQVNGNPVRYSTHTDVVKWIKGS